jgi:hypothetical protein
MKKILAYFLVLALITLAIVGVCAGCGDSSSSNPPPEAEPELTVETIVDRLQPIQERTMLKVSVSGLAPALGFGSSSREVSPVMSCR